MDLLNITQLSLQASIGVYPWEQQVRQTVHLDLQLGIDARVAAASDALDATIDYANLQEQLQAFYQDRHFNLLETLAEQTAQFILDNFTTPRVQLTAHKPGACPGAKSVSVYVLRCKI